MKKLPQLMKSWGSFFMSNDFRLPIKIFSDFLKNIKPGRDIPDSYKRERTNSQSDGGTGAEERGLFCRSAERSNQQTANRSRRRNKSKKECTYHEETQKKIAFWNTGSVNAGGTVCTDSRQCCGDKIAFTDVASTAYYTESVPWAVEIRIVSGTRRQLLLLMQPAGREIQRV